MITFWAFTFNLALSLPLLGAYQSPSPLHVPLPLPFSAVYGEKGEGNIKGEKGNDKIKKMWSIKI